MKILFLLLLMTGCTAPGPVVESSDSAPPPAAERVEETAAPEPARPRRPAKAPPSDILPPCVSVPGDKQTAILQKLECLVETADRKLPLPKAP